ITRPGMGRIYNYGTGRDDFLFQSDFHRLHNQHIKQLNVLQTLFSELGQGTWVDDRLFRSHAEKVFEGHIVHGPLYDILVREVIDGFEQEVFEQTNRVNGISAVVRAILLSELLKDKREIHKIHNSPKKIVLRNNQLVELCILT